MSDLLVERSREGVQRTDISTVIGRCLYEEGRGRE